MQAPVSRQNLILVHSSSEKKVDWYCHFKAIKAGYITVIITWWLILNIRSWASNLKQDLLISTKIDADRQFYGRVIYMLAFVSLLKECNFKNLVHKFDFSFSQLSTSIWSQVVFQIFNIVLDALSHSTMPISERSFMELLPWDLKINFLTVNLISLFHLIPLLGSYLWWIWNTGTNNLTILVSFLFSPSKNADKNM